MADNGGLHDVLVRTEDRFDLGGIDVETRTDDHFLGAADNVQAVAVETRQIAGIEPTLAVDDFCGQLGGTIVAEHHVAAANMQLPDFTSCRRNAVERSDPHLYA